MAIARTRAEVARIITGFVDDTGGRWDWDDFSSVRIKDPDLEIIRDIVTDFPVRFPPEIDGWYCNEQGFNLLRRIRDELLKPDPDLKQFATHPE